ncbi:MAG: hypothetical protein FWC43_06835 [Planctomycetaceae bacterium]|nr:hypothetical protein [Planctomycetaceae bacterium]
MNSEKATRLVLKLIELTEQNQIEWIQNITHDEDFSTKSFWGYLNGKYFRLYGPGYMSNHQFLSYKLQLWSEDKTFEYEYPYTSAYYDLFKMINEQNYSFADKYTDELLSVGSPNDALVEA